MSAVLNSPAEIHSPEWRFPLTGEMMYLMEDDTGNLRANRVPSESELDLFYANLFPRAAYERRGKSLQGKHRAQRIAPYLRGIVKPAILDYGCGNGQFLKACQKRFPQARPVGFEMSEAHAEAIGRQLGIPVHHQWAKVETQYRESFDLITAWHVLEHTSCPRKILSNLASTLKPNGVCVIAVPNRESLGMRWKKQSWAWCQAPFIHPWHFSPRGLTQLASQVFPGSKISARTREAWDCNLLVDGLFAGFCDLLPGISSMARLRAESILRLGLFPLNELALNPLLVSVIGMGSELVVTIVKSGNPPSCPPTSLQ